MKDLLHSASGTVQVQMDFSGAPNNLSTTAKVRGGWKKLIAISIASNQSLVRGGLIVWHDADTMLNPNGELIARVRQAAAEDPDTDIWMQPGADLLASTPSSTWRCFKGERLSSLARRVTNANSLQAGVIIVRASAARTLTAVLHYYDAAAEARGQLFQHLKQVGIPEKFCSSQEQGPLIYYLLRHAARRVRLVGWLQHEVLLGESVASRAHIPSFHHYSGCSFTTKRARKCIARYCVANRTRSEAASWHAVHPTRQGGTRMKFRGDISMKKGSVKTRRQATGRCEALPGCCTRHPRAPGCAGLQAAGQPSIPSIRKADAGEVKAREE